MTGHRCNNVCARSHRLARPHATPYLSCDVGELLRDVGKAFVGVVVALLLLATVFIGWPVVAS